MGATLDLGGRIELVSMDPNFGNITIGLYEQLRHGAPEYVVHSYSRIEGVAQRLDFLVQVMVVLGGLEVADGRLRFPCGARHQLAIRRVFLEACKITPGAAVGPKPLAILDKKIGGAVTVTSLAPGLYEVSADGPPDSTAARVESISGGLKKLSEAEFVPGQPRQLQFACRQAHDALVGLLLPRALNVRAVLREEEMAASRGILVAPSAQQ